MNAFQFLCSQPWAIQAESLETLIAIAERTPNEQVVEAIARREGTTVEAVRARVGMPMDGVRNGYRRGPVAVLEIMGPIIPRADMFSEISGATSLDRFAQNLQTALDDPTVSAIVLAIDSPGGQVTGVSETAEMIAQATMRKPVSVYVEGAAASAAYWLASAASEIVLSPTSLVGSIGTVMVADTKKKEGRIEIVSSQSPHKRPDLTTQSGRGRVQMMVDAMTEVFVADVARHRDVSVETVLSDFGQGDVLIGQAAIQAGMADRLGSLESLISELTSGYKPDTPKPKPQAEALPSSEGSMNVNELKAGLASLLGLSAAAPDPAIPGTGAAPATPTAETAPSAANEIGVDALLKAKDAEIASLRASLAKQAQSDATPGIDAFLASEVKARRVLPNEQPALRSLLLQAASDDASSPLASGSRLGSIQASISARPGHNLTGEAIPAADGPNTRIPDGSSVLPDGPPSPEDPEAPAPKSEMERLLKMTPVGKLALNRIK